LQTQHHWQEKNAHLFSFIDTDEMQCSL